jgi:hypothetical protein
LLHLKRLPSESGDPIEGWIEGSIKEINLKRGMNAANIVLDCE